MTNPSPDLPQPQVEAESIDTPEFIAKLHAWWCVSGAFESQARQELIAHIDSIITARVAAACAHQALAYRRIIDTIAASQAAPAKAEGIPDVLFDGSAVYQEVLADSPIPPRTSRDNVAEVLDAVVRLMRRAALPPQLRSRHESAIRSTRRDPACHAHLCRRNCGSGRRFPSSPCRYGGTMQEELKSCPFCGGEAQNDFIEGESYLIECYVCRAETGIKDSEAEAIAAWNRRATSGAASGEVPEGATRTQFVSEAVTAVAPKWYGGVPQWEESVQFKAPAIPPMAWLTEIPDEWANQVLFFKADDSGTKVTAACPNYEQMTEHACSDRSQCWEPCGTLGKSAAHAKPLKVFAYVDQLVQTEIADALAEELTFTVDGVVMSPMEYINYLHDQLAGQQAGGPGVPAEEDKAKSDE